MTMEGENPSICLRAHLIQESYSILNVYFPDFCIFVIIFLSFVIYGSTFHIHKILMWFYVTHSLFSQG